MRIVPLESSLEPTFWEHVNRDIPHYFFFALDWKYYRDRTRILLALEEDRIDGMMLIYRESVVQLRGSARAIRELLRWLNLEKVEVTAEVEHKECVLERFKPLTSHRLILMTLRRGEERIIVKHPIVRLGVSDAEDIAALMRHANPESWGEVTGQQIVEGIGRGMNWFGIKVDGELVSIGGMRLTEWAGIVTTVATHEAHRNRGYATSVVSEMVKQILEMMPMAMIHVLSDNPPAIRVYEKVGFKPYKIYFFMRGERR